jgi:WhiB family transcriptional regulator, redox-sensing transcriptional regulator
MARNGVEGGNPGVVFRDFRQTNNQSEFPQKDAWKLKGSCRGLDPSVMYPDPQEEEAVAAAKAVCAPCPVKEICLDTSIRDRDNHGIKGGYDEKERRRLVKKLKQLKATS